MRHPDIYRKSKTDAMKGQHHRQKRLESTKQENIENRWKEQYKIQYERNT